MRSAERERWFGPYVLCPLCRKRSNTRKRHLRARQRTWSPEQLVNQRGANVVHGVVHELAPIDASDAVARPTVGRSTWGFYS